MLPTEQPNLEHRPVRLRAWRASDAPVVSAAATDPLIPLLTSVPASGASDEIAAYIERQRAKAARGVGYSFVIADLKTDEAVGNIGLWTRDLDRGRASIGYWIANQFRHHGYAQAALYALTKWAITLPQLARIELYIEPWNEGSWRAAEAVGYMREGLLRRWQQVGDRRRDMWVYSLLPDADDFEED